MTWIRVEKDGLTKKEPGPIEADCQDDDTVAPGWVKKGGVEVGEVPEFQTAININQYQLINQSNNVNQLININGVEVREVPESLNSYQWQNY